MLLEDQDRSLWDRDRIDEGLRVLERASAPRAPGPYQLQAAIAAVHCGAGRAEDTDWTAIAALYEQLGRLAPSPIVELNRAVAVAMAEGPTQGLELVDALEGLEQYRLLHSTRADLLRRLDRPAEAAEAYRRALELTTNPTERAFLERRLGEVTAPESTGYPCPMLRWIAAMIPVRVSKNCFWTFAQPPNFVILNRPGRDGNLYRRATLSTTGR